MWLLMVCTYRADVIPSTAPNNVHRNEHPQEYCTDVPQSESQRIEIEIGNIPRKEYASPMICNHLHIGF